MKATTLNGTTATVTGITTTATGQTVVIRSDGNDLGRSRGREVNVRVRSALFESGGAVRRSVVLPELFDSTCDVAVACAAAGIVEDATLIGELALDGRVRPVRGLVPRVLACDGEVIVPECQAREAAIAAGHCRVYAARDLEEVLRHLRGGEQLPRVEHVRPENAKQSVAFDASVPCPPEVRTAVDQGKNLVIIAPPGAGKTMVARRIPSLLGRMDESERISVADIQSAAGLLPVDFDGTVRRPFRAPHHTVSDAGLLGGGSPVRPGEVSLAHHGVLFLDDLSEFRTNVVRDLGWVLRHGRITVRGAALPARSAMVVAASNPCPCGWSPTDRCTCSVETRTRYGERLAKKIAEIPNAIVWTRHGKL